MTMAKKPLTAETLTQLSDGYVGKVIDHSLAQIWADLRERGDDGKKRTLTLTLTFVADGAQVGIDAKASVKLPNLQPPMTVARLDQFSGALMFNPEVPTNPEQTTFSDIDGGE
jgi:hypothetical protein